MCGLVKLVDISVALDSIGRVSTNSGMISDLQTQYSNATSESSKDVIKGQIVAVLTTVRLDFNTERQQDSIALENIESELNTINCTEIIILKWKEIM